MKKKTFIIFGTFLLSIIFVFNMKQISTDDLIGKYVNNNTEPLLEGPKPIQERIDTLILMRDNKFSSMTWGDGTYVIKKSFTETRIRLTYSYSMGKAGYEAIISKSLFGKIKIWLNSDLNFYFEKI